MGIESVVFVPIHGKNGVLGALSVFSTDASRLFDERDLKTAEELAWRAALSIDNENLYLMAKEAIRLRDDFLSIVSHDLKNPLSALRLNAGERGAVGGGGVGLPGTAEWVSYL